MKTIDDFHPVTDNIHIRRQATTSPQARQWLVSNSLVSVNTAYALVVTLGH